MRRAILWLTFVIAFVLPAAAHDPGLSSAAVEVGRAGIRATVTLAAADAAVARARGGESDVAIARGSLALAIDGRALEPEAVDAGREGDNVELRLVFGRPPGTRLTVRAALFESLPAGHRQYLAVRDQAGRRLAERVLSAAAAGCDVELEAAAPGTAETIRQFLALGVEHIVTGFDHLVFLLGLLLAGSRLRQALAIITSFTVAHSLTLGLASLGLVALPSRLVEPLIALSIAYVGLENIWSRDLDRRWRVTFLFGLAHGFGFASALGEIGIASHGAGVAVPLVAFNLGVELGQIAIAGAFLPVLGRLRQRPSFTRRWVPAGSAAVALAGGYWLVERVLFP